MSRVDFLLNNSRIWHYSQVSVTAAKWIDSWARLQFRFYLNLFSCLRTTNLSRGNNKSRAGLRTLFNFLQQTVNPRYITRLFTLSCCHQRCSLDRYRMQMTHFSFYDHDATQSGCAHRLLETAIGQASEFCLLANDNSIPKRFTWSSP